MNRPPHLQQLLSWPLLHSAQPRHGGGLEVTESGAELSHTVAASSRQACVPVRALLLQIHHLRLSET